MSGLTIAFWEQIKDTELPKVEKIIENWLFQVQKLSEITLEDLTENQFKRLHNLENIIKTFVGFLKIIEELGESYTKESAETADILMKYLTENGILKQEYKLLKIEIENIKKQNEVLLKSFKKTLNKINNE